MRNHEPFPSFSLSLCPCSSLALSLSLPAILPLSYSLSVPLSPFSPQPRSLSPFPSLYVCTRARVFAPNVCARTCVRGARGVHRVAFFLPPPSFLFTRSSPPKQIVKTASAFVVIGQSFPKNQWPLVEYGAFLPLPLDVAKG